MNVKQVLKIIILILAILLSSLFIIRLFSSRHLDDLHPNILCDEDLIKKSDYLAVVPKFENKSILDNKEWCDYIKSFNKSLVMHGVYHTYKEFGTLRDSDYIQEGKDIFFDCFGFNPEEFKAPQLALSRKNKKILELEFKFKIYTKLNRIFHKTYHCNDSGILSNKLESWI
jgi:predicted deacetylase